MSPQRRNWAFLAQGDELLDWRQMVARYPEAEHVILEGSDHALSDFGNRYFARAGFFGFGLSCTPPTRLKNKSC